MTVLTIDCINIYNLLEEPNFDINLWKTFVLLGGILIVRHSILMHVVILDKC